MRGGGKGKGRGGRTVRGGRYGRTYDSGRGSPFKSTAKNDQPKSEVSTSDSKIEDSNKVESSSKQLSTSQSSGKVKKVVICYACGQEGHYKSECEWNFDDNQTRNKGFVDKAYKCYFLGIDKATQAYICWVIDLGVERISAHVLFDEVTQIRVQISNFNVPVALERRNIKECTYLIGMIYRDDEDKLQISTDEADDIPALNHHAFRHIVHCPLCYKYLSTCNFQYYLCLYEGLPQYCRFPPCEATNRS